MKKGILFLSLAAVLISGMVGCSKKTGPTNADIVKAAIHRALAENCNIITPSISVVSKSTSDDSSAVTIHYQCGGLAGAQKEMTLHLVPSKDGAGRMTWESK